MRRPRFDEQDSTTVVLVLLLVGRLLWKLGDALRAIDDNLADFDDLTQEA